MKNFFRNIGIKVLQLLYSKKTKPQSRSLPSADTDDETGRVFTGIKHLAPMAKVVPNAKTFVAPNKWWPDKKHFYCWHYMVSDNWSPRQFINFFNSRGLNTDFMDKEGQIWQNCDGDRSGWHAGRKSKVPRDSIYGELAGKKISHLCRGMEIDCWGRLKKVGSELRADIKKRTVVPRENARYVTTEMGYKRSGWYEKLTEKQEQELAKHGAYLIAVGLPPENLLGHDEISGYKSDLGGSLSMPYDEFIETKVMPLVPNYKGMKF